MRTLFYFTISIVLFGAQKTSNTVIEGDFTVNYYDGFDCFENKISIEKIEISQPVTLAQYKYFLQSEKIEEAKFKPDFRVLKSKYSSDFSFPTISWSNYYQSGNFDTYPVLGVTWESAVEYCKWLTKKSSDENYEYRLATPKELLVYFQYFAKNQQFTHRSEWTINAYDESYFFNNKMDYYTYDANENDSPALKRKTIIYTSLKNNILRSNYQDCSDEFTSFRVVKALKNKKIETTIKRHSIGL